MWNQQRGEFNRYDRCAVTIVVEHAACFWLYDLSFTRLELASRSCMATPLSLCDLCLEF